MLVQADYIDRAVENVFQETLQSDEQISIRYHVDAHIHIAASSMLPS